MRGSHLGTTGSQVVIKLVQSREASGRRRAHSAYLQGGERYDWPQEDELSGKGHEQGRGASVDVAGSNQGPPVEDLVCVVTGGCADQGSEAESSGC